MLIETKLHAPVARKEWVERQELIDYLADTKAKLILIAAPAGFGKTTLAAQWRSGAVGDRPFAWVSLDRGDDDPSRLWWHVVCALHLACPGFDSEKLQRAEALERSVYDPVLRGARPWLDRRFLGSLW